MHELYMDLYFIFSKSNQALKLLYRSNFLLVVPEKPPDNFLRVLRAEQDTAMLSQLYSELLFHLSRNVPHKKPHSNCKIKDQSTINSEPVGSFFFIIHGFLYFTSFCTFCAMARNLRLFLITPERKEKKYYLLAL